MVNDLPGSVEVANRLRPALLKIARELRRETRTLGITGGQATLLYLIHRSPGIGVRDLAHAEAISAPAMSGYVDRLEAAGLVTRARSGVDRRRVGLTLTPEGERVLRKVRSRRTAWLAARLEALEPDERARIDAAVGPLHKLLEARA